MYFASSNCRGDHRSPAACRCAAAADWGLNAAHFDRQGTASSTSLWYHLPTRYNPPFCGAFRIKRQAFLLHRFRIPFRQRGRFDIEVGSAEPTVNNAGSSPSLRRAARIPCGILAGGSPYRHLPQRIDVVPRARTLAFLQLSACGKRGLRKGIHHVGALSERLETVGGGTHFGIFVPAYVSGRCFSPLEICPRSARVIRA